MYTTTHNPQHKPGTKITFYIQPPSNLPMKSVQILTMPWRLTILLYMTFPVMISSLGLSRRSAFKNSGAAIVASIAGGGGWIAPTPSGATTKPDGPFQSYRIIPDASASLNPTLRDIKVRFLVWCFSHVIAIHKTFRYSSLTS